MELPLPLASPPDVVLCHTQDTLLLGVGSYLSVVDAIDSTGCIKSVHIVIYSSIWKQMATILKSYVRFYWYTVVCSLVSISFSINIASLKQLFYSELILTCSAYRYYIQYFKTVIDVYKLDRMIKDEQSGPRQNSLGLFIWNEFLKFFFFNLKWVSSYTP